VVENYYDGDAYVLLNHVTQLATRNNAVALNTGRPFAAEYAGDAKFAPSASAKTTLTDQRVRGVMKNCPDQPGAIR